MRYMGCYLAGLSDQVRGSPPESVFPIGVTQGEIYWTSPPMRWTETAVNRHGISQWGRIRRFVRGTFIQCVPFSSLR